MERETRMIYSEWHDDYRFQIKKWWGWKTLFNSWNKNDVRMYRDTYKWDRAL